MKFSSQLVNEYPDTYNATERVFLISNFLSTLLSGEYRSIDYSDGSGMNLLDVFEKRWIEQIGRMYGGVDVREKLGIPKPTLRVGCILKFY